jgi:hypothetical protein
MGLPRKERRASPRYALGLKLHYWVYYRRKLLVKGSGVALDMSSSGLRFRADRPLKQGLNIEVAITWPLTLEGGVRLKLVARGRIMWTSAVEAGVRIEHHEFRTQPPSGSS